MTDATRQTLDALYYHLIGGTDDPAAMLDDLGLVLDDVQDMYETVKLYGADAALAAVAEANAPRPHLFDPANV